MVGKLQDDDDDDDDDDDGGDGDDGDDGDDDDGGRLPLRRRRGDAEEERSDTAEAWDSTRHKTIVRGNCHKTRPMP